MMPRNYYDPETRRVHLAPDASLYERFHELAHAAQHASGSLAFRAWLRLRWYIVVGYLSIIWLEYDAYWRTRRVLQRLGAWNDDCENEARQGLRSYRKRQEL